MTKHYINIGTVYNYTHFSFGDPGAAKKIYSLMGIEPNARLELAALRYLNQRI
jgi:hypothetical protein